MSLPLQDHVVYGPVRSRRLGRSLGINLLPIGAKVCNMNCAYCQYGWSGPARRTQRPQPWPTAAIVDAAVSSRLRRAARDDELIDRLTVAGHGEPTLHPEFEEIARRLQRVRDRLAPGLKLAILSNSTTASWPDVRRGLEAFDERYMKLDAGDPITFSRINGQAITGTSIAEIVDALTALRPVVVQAMFVGDREGRVDNSSEGAVEEWLRAIERIQPDAVHVYTLDRPPALSGLKPLTARRLREIANHVWTAGVPAIVFPPATLG